MESTLNKPLVRNLVYSLLGKSPLGGWSGKPSSWPDIRKNLIPNSIRLLADNRYPLGFTATVTGGYSVDVDGKKYGDYASNTQCSFTTSDWEIDEDLPIGYKRVQGYTCDNNVLWQITNFKLKGSDTVKISFSVNAGCNVFGCYQGTDATDNYDLYVSTSSGSKYLRYGDGTYLSYWSASNLGERFDVTVSPTGTSGMPQDSTWSQLDFTSANDLLIGSTTLTGTSAKLKGNLYGNIEVVGRLNLIPCERLSDNALGYYDTYSQTFYAPNGTPTSLGYDTTHLFSYPIDYPTGATKAHIVDIYPQTEGNNITAFKCTRVAASGTEQQGVLWAHFNIKNYVDLHQSFGSAVQPKVVQSNLTAVTAKNNKLFVNTIYQAFNQCFSLEYVPDFYTNTSQMTMNYAFAECNKLVKIALNNFKIDSGVFTFIDTFALKNLLLKNCSFINAEILLSFITRAKSLENFTLDVSDATGLTCIGVYSTSPYFMAGFKSLRVSNEAPLDFSTSPQINVSHTGMDRAALVQLFNDLPYNVGYTVVGSPTIENGVLSGTSGSNYVKISDLNFNLSSFEIVTKVKAPSDSGWQPIQRLWNTSPGFQGGLAMTNHYFYWAVQGSNFGNTYLKCSNVMAESGVWYYIKQQKDGNTLSISISTDGTNWQDTRSVEVATLNPFQNYIFYGQNQDIPWSGSIDLNETYIKINDVYWFRGQPAMTKTINVVGCTGTSSLTADDRAIVTDKGWSITF